MSKTLDSPFDLDLKRHGIIEASAGTGKTYTIENLALRVLIEEFSVQSSPPPISKILIVTFTEKATGELKHRIRKKIEEEKLTLENKLEESEFYKKQKVNKESPQSVIHYLQVCLDHFDSASIFTIHGFCNKILKEYSFENGELFQADIVNDINLLNNLYIQEKRKHWYREYNEKLYDILRLSEFGKEKWDKSVLEIASRFREDDILEPNPTHDFLQKIQDVFVLIQEKLNGLKSVIGTINSENLEESSFVKLYKSLDVPKTSLNKRIRDYIIPAIKLTIMSGEKNVNKIDFLIETFEYISSTKGNFPELKKLNKGLTPPEDVNSFVQVIDELQKITIDSSIPFQLQSNTIYNLYKRLGEYKRRNGLISYNDMLQLVLDTINRESEMNSKELLDNLRQEYLYVFVDEFQDTDKTQWEIFKKIFLYKNTKNKLFLIGDPKQSIYSFRGTDLAIYKSARESIQKSYPDSLYNLKTNYRSTKELIEGFNWIFQKAPNSHAFSSLEYTDVFSPKEQTTKINKDNTNRNALTLVKLNEESSGSQIRSEYAEFICKEIQSLTKKGNFVYSQKSDKEKELNYDDICILVRNRSEANFILDFFNQAGIPSTFYKNAGIYQSSEALHIYYLLDGILNIENEEALKKAFLTHFFSISLEDLIFYSELSFSHPLKKKFVEWNELAEQKKYTQLFESILEDTEYEIHSILKTNGERILSNTKQILRSLEQIAIEKNMEFRDVVTTMLNWKENKIEIEEGMNIENIGSEEPKVKIMTIHTSKGLEFPIVFLAGGFTASKQQDYYKCHKENGLVVYDLSKNPNNKIRYEQEEKEENDRLYYVAFTRAILRLYIPFFQTPKRGSGGYLSEYICPHFQNLLEQKTKIPYFLSNITSQDVPDVEVIKQPITKTKKLLKNEDIEQKLRELNDESSRHNFRNRSLYLTSYTQEKKSKDNPQFSSKTIVEDIEKHKDLEEKDEPNESVELIPTPLKLPSGALTGNVVHKILEKVDFSVVKNSNSYKDLLTKEEDLISKTFKEFRMPETREVLLERTSKKVNVDYKEMVAKMVFQTLKTKIPELGISLSELDSYNKIPELEFYYPIDLKNTIIKGEIDLLFRVGEKFYILDWKTDTLLSYDAEDLESHILKEGYDYQYNFYTLALHKYLAKYLENYSFEKNFGGVFYIFLRGIMESEDKGVFFIPGKKLELEEIKKFIKEHFSY